MVDYHWDQLVFALGYYFCHFSLKKAKKRIFDPKIGPVDDKNALKPQFWAVWSFQKVIGGFSIGIWKKSRNFKEKQVSEKSAGTMCHPSPLGLSGTNIKWDKH